MRGVAQFGDIVIHVEVNRFGTLTFKDHHIPTSHLELSTPVTTRVGAGNRPGQRAFGNHRVASACGGHGSGQGTGCPNDFVRWRQGIDFRVNLFYQVFRTQAARA